MLEEDYRSGRATADMSVDTVIGLRRAIYEKVPRQNFATNWRALKNRVNENIERAKEDRARYDNDVGEAGYMLAKDCPWEWHGSEAQQRLKEDVAAGRDMRYSPELLFYKRKEYQIRCGT